MLCGREKLVHSACVMQYLFHSNSKTANRVFTSCHSHYEVYAVITDQSPDTSAILPEATDTSYVTFAGRASSGLSPQIRVGTGVTGEVTLANGQQVNYDNRFVRLGANYFFFIQLYSSEVGASTCVVHVTFTNCMSFLSRMQQDLVIANLSHLQLVSSAVS